MSVRCIPHFSDGKMWAPFESMVTFFAGCEDLLRAFLRLVFMAIQECKSHQHF